MCLEEISDEIYEENKQVIRNDFGVIRGVNIAEIDELLFFEYFQVHFEAIRGSHIPLYTIKPFFN